MKLSQTIANRLYAFYSRKRTDYEYRKLVSDIRRKATEAVDHHTTWSHSQNWVTPFTQAGIEAEQRKNNFKTVIELNGRRFKFISSLHICDGAYHYLGTFWTDDTLTDYMRWAKLIDEYLSD